MKGIGVLLLSTLLLSAATHTPIKSLWESEKGSTVSKIDSTRRDLSATDQKQKQLNQQLSKIAKSILQAEKENRALDRALKRLAKDKEANEERYSEAKKKIDAYQGKIETLDQSIKQQHSHFVKMLIDQFSLIMAMNRLEKKSIDSVVTREIYEVYKQKSTQDIQTLKAKIDSSLKQKNEVVGYQKKIEKSISKISRQREAYLKKKREKQKLLKKLAADEAAYRKSIKELMKKQSMIRNTLAKLNIIRKEEIAKEQAIERERQAEIKRRATARSQARTQSTEGHVSAKAFSDNRRVKQVGSSYHRDKIYRYRGAKTISPLKHAKVVKSFGTYIDPIYKMKIFNESITLKAPKSDAKVRNVLNGKVVFAGENSMLGKMVVIAHGGRLHTVYAGLSRISPMIKKGSRVKKGAIIGKVKRKLIFEATKDSKYINPIRLIRL